MGDSQSSCHLVTNNQINKPKQRKKKRGSKQSKRWNILKRKSESNQEREKPHFPDDACIDLDIVNPEIPSSVMSWNCHHKLAEIRNNLNKFQSKFVDIKLPKTKLSRTKLSKTKTKSLNDLTINSSKHNDLWLELDFITNEIESLIYGITHNFLDGIENERVLIDGWFSGISDVKTHEISMIVFQIDSMTEIHQYLGWKSGDNMIAKTGKTIKNIVIGIKKIFIKNLNYFILILLQMNLLLFQLVSMMKLLLILSMHIN